MQKKSFFPRFHSLYYYYYLFIVLSFRFPDFRGFETLPFPSEVIV